MFDNLEHYCLADKHDFTALNGFEQLDNPDGLLLYKDNGSDVLGIAHLDHVGNSTWFYQVKNTVYSIALDDRLGVTLILYLESLRGIDVLLTDLEELGRSTAAWFAPEKSYSWSFSFDRRGTDVVLYQFDNAETRAAVSAAGFDIGVGIYSDISFQQLDCCGFNFGCGYYRAHTPYCHAHLPTTILQVERFLEFYQQNHNRCFPYTEERYYHKFTTLNYCEICNQPFEDYYGDLICDECFDRLVYEDLDHA